ncbi:hypothetical protein KKB40_06040 [Patescibacteria group bacterium]|nr:hypothetical protein [Patescibacteria group bacterium]
MWSKNFDSIYKEFLVRYKDEKIPMKEKQLRQMIMDAEKVAKENYKKLKKPKTCSIDLYTQIWVEQTISLDWATKSIKPISVDTPPFFYKASVDFHLLFSEELLLKLKKELFDAKPNERKKVWDNFDLPLKKLEKKFVDMTKERNEHAKEKGYSNRIDMSLDWHKIPKTDYKMFTKNTDKLIEYCNDQLSEFTDLPKWFYSKFNLPCFLCRISSFPFKTQDDVLDFVGRHFKLLSNFRNKIHIQLGEYSKMSYKKETDSFEITIDESGNTRHQLLDLLHELAHVVDCLQTLKSGVIPYERGTYKGEKEAIKIEFALLKKISPEIYKAKFGDTLLNFWEVLFQIELYSNPNQDLSKLYAKTFNQKLLINVSEKQTKKKIQPTLLITF